MSTAHEDRLKKIQTLKKEFGKNGAELDGAIQRLVWTSANFGSATKDSIAELDIWNAVKKISGGV